jgi:hypothetical protein
MTDTLPALQGGCLCGAVRYEARPAHRDGYYCHCRMCQLAFGNTRAAYLNLRKDEVRWLGPPSYYASSKIARRGFCSRCGTPLSFEFLDSERMDLSAGSLDDPAQVRPTEHFSIETRIDAWHADDGLPGQRLDSNERIGGLWRKAYGEAVVPGLQAVRDAATIDPPITPTTKGPA